MSSHPSKGSGARFDARDLKPYAEPVTAGDLRPAEIYFAVEFLDEHMLVPSVRPVVYLGADLFPKHPGKLCFQDAASFLDGVRFDENGHGEGSFYAQAADELTHIFAYEHALNVLLWCSLRRRGLDPD
jgi:hypothetical protein